MTQVYHPQWVLGAITENGGSFAGISCSREIEMDQHSTAMDMPPMPQALPTYCSVADMVQKFPTGQSYTFAVTLTYPVSITELPSSLPDTAVQWTFKDETDATVTETSVPTTFYIDESKTTQCTLSDPTLDCPCKQHELHMSCWFLTCC